MSFMFLVEVFDNGKRILNDKIELPFLTETCIKKKILIPGFSRVNQLDIVAKKPTEWRHLGLDYKARVEEISLGTL